MKFKRLVTVLLGLSIILNIFMFYEYRKYKMITMDNAQYMLSSIFINADELDMELKKIIMDTNEVDNDQLNRMQKNYENIIINAYNIRDTAIKSGRKNNEKIGDFNGYGRKLYDLNYFISSIKKENNSSKFVVEKEDINFLMKIRSHINDIQKVRDKYTYTKDDTRHIKFDEWVKITKDLSVLGNLD